MPYFKTTQQERENAQIAATIITTCLASGIKLKADEVYQKLGFTKPSEQDEIIETPQDVQMAMQQEQMERDQEQTEYSNEQGEVANAREEAKDAAEAKKKPEPAKKKKAESAA